MNKVLRAFLTLSICVIFNMASTYANEAVATTAATPAENHATAEAPAATEAHATTDTHAATDAHGAEHGAPADGKYDPVPFIMHHIADANDFHIIGDLTMPLPIIAYNKTTGAWLTGMSSMFHPHHGEGTVEVNGFKMEHSRVHPVNHEEQMIDFSITKNVFVMLLGFVILALVFFSVSATYKKRQGQAPKGFQGLLEPIFQFVVDDIAKQNIGKNYQKFSVYLVCVFFFILISNLLGLIPFSPDQQMYLEISLSL